MQRRTFFKSLVAIVASPMLLLKKRKREADRRITVVQGDACGGWSAPLNGGLPWPAGNANPEYDYWSPIKVNYDSSLPLEYHIEKRLGRKV